MERPSADKSLAEWWAKRLCGLTDDVPLGAEVSVPSNDLRDVADLLSRLSETAEVVDV